MLIWSKKQQQNLLRLNKMTKNITIKIKKLLLLLLLH